MAPRRRGDEDPFFPGRGRADLSKVAKAICRECPVQTQCLDYRLRTDSGYGIWGSRKFERGKHRPTKEDSA